MFKKSILVSICMILAGYATSYAMQQQEDFIVAIRNNYGAQIEVNYTSQGKQLIKVVNLNENLLLGPVSLLSGEIKIYRAGAVMSHLAMGYTVPMQALEHVWAQQKHEHADALLLIVTSSPGRLVIQYHPTQKATLRIIKEIQKIEGDVIDQFPGLQKYGLEKVLTPDQILAIRSPNEVVISAGWVSRATTGEDIARYILELPIGYNADSVKKSFNTLSLTWHPDKQQLPAMKDLATQVFRVITHARDLLMQALREKDQTQ